MSQLTFRPHDPAPDTVVYHRRHWRLTASDGRDIALVFGDDETNVRRLVACWNALEGASIEQIERSTKSAAPSYAQLYMAVAELGDALRVIRHAETPLTLANARWKVDTLLTKLGSAK